MRAARIVGNLLVGTALAILSTAAPVCAELGWKETDYAKRFGKAIRSPLTPNEAQFAAPGSGSVLVVFADGRSREEAWLIGRDASFVPQLLMEQARAAVRGQPIRRVEFQVERAPAAEIFESKSAGLTVQVDYRRGAIVRIGRCRGSTACTLLERLLAVEKTTDDLLARTQARMREERK